MFCSKCGKTLAPDIENCLYCGAEVGESRFEGTPYTSAQKHILPGEKFSFVDMAGIAKPADEEGKSEQAVQEAGAEETQAAAVSVDAVEEIKTEEEKPIWEAPSYTRTTYTTMEDSQGETGDVDTRTTYRPVFDNASGPEEMRRDLRAILTDPEEEEEAAPAAEPEYLSEEAINTLNAVDEALQMEEVDYSYLKPQPIRSAGRAGISSGVSDYIQRLEANQQRKAARRKRVYEEDIPEENVYTAPEEEVPYEEPETVDPEIDTEQSEVFDDIDEEEFEEMRYGRVLGVKDVLKFSLIIIVAAALFVGGFLWFRNFRDNQSSAPIEGVTEVLYDDGIALLKSHAATEHISEMLGLYTRDGLVNMTLKLQEDANAIDALMPAEPALNDQLFVSALQAIQSNIGNATIMDATAISQGKANAVAESDARWKIVNDSITLLESASTATHLTGILNGEQIDVTNTSNEAPTPTPAPTYSPMTRGDKSDAVLDMQNRLYELGYLLDDRDGNYGSKTQTAIKRFQTDAGLEVTGIADSNTLALLYSEEAPMTEYAQTTRPEPTATPDPNAAE